MVLNNLQLIGIVKPEVREQSKLYPYIELTVPFVYRGFDLVKDYAKEMIPEEPEEEKEKTEPSGPVVETQCFASPNSCPCIRLPHVPARS